MIFFVAKFITKIFGVDITRAQHLAIILSAFLAIAAVGITFGVLTRACDNRKIEKIEANKSAATANVLILEANKQIQNLEVKNSETNTNMAVENRAVIVNKDSSTYDGKKAGEKFCERNPNDSTCK